MMPPVAGKSSLSAGNVMSSRSLPGLIVDLCTPPGRPLGDDLIHDAERSQRARRVGLR